MVQRFGCDDWCPAECVYQNIHQNADLDPTANGTILFMTLRDKPLGSVAEAIGQGASTVEEVTDALDQMRAWGSPNARPDEMYGNLSKSTIARAVIACVLRSARGECGFTRPANSTLETIEKVAPLPPPKVRPRWLDEPLESFRPVT